MYIPFTFKNSGIPLIPVEPKTTDIGSRFATSDVLILKTYLVYYKQFKTGTYVNFED